MNITLPPIHEATIVCYQNASMPAVSGASVRQWTDPTDRTQHEGSIDAPSTPTINFQNARSHYMVCYTPVTDGEWHPPTRWYVGPCDRDGDHRVTSTDYFSWVAAWMEQASGSDYNGDGRVDSQDFFLFSTDWANFNRMSQ